MPKHRSYLPALKYEWLSSLYDPLIRWMMPEGAFKPQLVKQARVEPQHRVLDVGCGTATLTLLIKSSCPNAEVVGLDCDQKMLDIAQKKASKAGLEIKFNCGMAFQLPYPDQYFDRVVSSLVLHHLTHADKIRTLAEIFRVLRPDGELHVGDWGQARSVSMRMAFLVVQMVDGFARTSDNVQGLLPKMFAEAGFQEVQETASYRTCLGPLSLYQAKKSLAI